MARYTIAFIILSLFLLSCTAPDSVDTPPVPPAADIPDAVPETPAEPPVEPVTGISLAEYLDMLDAREYLVIYDMTTETREQYSSSSLRVPVTHYANVELNSFRQDSSDDTGVIRIFLIDDVVVTCLGGADVEACEEGGEGWSCIEEPISEALIAPMRVTMRETASDYDLVPTDSQEIAGIEAECFRYRFLPFDEITYCFSPEGVPLLTYTKSETTLTEMRANEYGLSASSLEFEFPTEPVPYPPSE